MLSLIPTILVSAALVITAIAAVTDTRSGVIPNALTLPVLLGAPLAHVGMGGAAGLFASVIGAVLCALIPLLFFVRGALGGGDLKLFAALGALLGAQLGLRIELSSFAMGTFVGVVIAARRGVLLSTLRRAALLAPIKPLRADAQGELLEMKLGVPIWIATWLVCALEVMP